MTLKFFLSKRQKAWQSIESKNSFLNFGSYLTLKFWGFSTFCHSNIQNVWQGQGIQQFQKVSKVYLSINEVQSVKYSFNCNNTTSALQEHDYDLFVVVLYNGILLWFTTQQQLFK